MFVSGEEHDQMRLRGPVSRFPSDSQKGQRAVVSPGLGMAVPLITPAVMGWEVRIKALAAEPQVGPK